MEFNGLIGADFDFFRKKDRLSKEEYEKGRNELKLHFRGLCYELQKMYHKKTEGVLELEKEFQNFNKRSLYINARNKTKLDGFFVNIQMDGNGFGAELEAAITSLEDYAKVLSILANNKKLIWNYIMGNKNMQIYVDFGGKEKKLNTIKIGSLDINSKNYDNLMNLLQENLSKGKYPSRITMGYVFSKNECVKQGKKFTEIVYDGITSLMELSEKIG